LRPKSGLTHLIALQNSQRIFVKFLSKVVPNVSPAAKCIAAEKAALRATFWSLTRLEAIRQLLSRIFTLFEFIRSKLLLPIPDS